MAHEGQINRSSQKLYRTLSEGPSASYGRSRSGLFINSQLQTDSMLSEADDSQRSRNHRAIDAEEGSIIWWKKQIKSIQKWFYANPLKLGIEDETIRYVNKQMRKGNFADCSHEKRLKYWKRISSEFLTIPASPVVDVQSTFSILELKDKTENENKSSRDVLSTRSHSPERFLPSLIMDEDETGDHGHLKRDANKTDEIRVQPSFNKSASDPAPLLDPLPVSCKKLSDMSLLERQNYCLLKKQHKIRLEKQKKERMELAQCTFSPTRFSKSVLVSPRQSRFSFRTRPKLRERPKTSSNIWRPRADQREKPTNTSIKISKRNLRKRRTKISNQKCIQRPENDVQVVDEHKKLRNDVNNQISESKVAEKDPKRDQMKASKSNPSAPRYSFSSSSSSTKGIIILQDSRLFELGSIYRRKDTEKPLGQGFITSHYDKLHREAAAHALKVVAGVSLLVGIKYGTRSEEVVSVTFDRKLFSEKDASRHVEQNLHRFIQNRIN